MSFEVVDGVFTCTLDLIATTALAGLLLLYGYWMRKAFPVLEKYCLPAPVIGGISFAILTLILHSTGLMAFSLDTTLQTPFMIAFFACVGFGGSFALLKAGGKQLLIFLVICWVLAVVQNVVGVGMAKLVGIHPVLGVMAGAVSMTGGHGNAAAFGPTAEAAGVAGATVVAVAAATFGLVVGSLVGGPTGRWFVNHFKVPIESDETGIDREAYEKATTRKDAVITSRAFITHMVLVLVFCFFGGLAVKGVAALHIKNFALPAYVGAMFAAIIFRNINDRFHAIEVDENILDIIRDVGIGFFLTMSIMTLKIWELAGLMLPLFAILIVQVIVVFLFIRFLVWPLMGRNYDAAVMCAGFTGVGIGVTATAVASMGAVTEHYKKDSFKAFLIVPLCCAVFIDIVAIPCIVFFISYFA